MNRPVMVIGCDGLTLDLLQPLAHNGELPTFSRLLDEGVWGVLRSVTNMTTGPTWASFATGCTPQTHGILHDFHHAADGYALVANRGADYAQPTFWDIASGAARTVIVLNVPLTYPARPVNGVLLAGIDAPSERAPGFAHPPGAYRELRRHAGEYLIDCGLAFYMQNDRLVEGVAAVERETEGRTRAAETFLRQLDWDLFVTVYSLPDVWQHYYWGAPVGSPQYERMVDGYRLLDRHVARLLAHLPQDGVVILCSDHGFAPLLGTRDHLNRWLAAQGLLHYRAAQRQSVASRAKQTLLTQMRRHISFRRRQQILAALPPLRRLIESDLRIGNIDWARTQVYAPLDHMELWVNVRGRQPAGIVDPTEYDALCKRVAADLLNWRDEQSNRPYLTRVDHQPYSEWMAHSRRHAGHLPPDLALHWNPDVVAPNLHPLIRGDHAPDGTLIVAGAHLCPQRLPAASLIDVAPLVLHLLGVRVPDDMEGSAPALD